MSNLFTKKVQPTYGPSNHAQRMTAYYRAEAKKLAAKGITHEDKMDKLNLEISQMESRLGVSDDGSPARNPHDHSFRSNGVVGTTAHNSFQPATIHETYIDTD